MQMGTWPLHYNDILTLNLTYDLLIIIFMKILIEICDIRVIYHEVTYSLDTVQCDKTFDHNFVSLNI